MGEPASDHGRFCHLSRVIAPIGRKVVGKGAVLGHVLGADPQPVDVVLTAGTQPSCLRFGGTATFAPGSRFKATSAAAPASCP